MRLYSNLPDEPRDKTPREEKLRRITRYVGWSRVPAALRSHPADANENIAYQGAWIQLKEALIIRRDALVARLLREPSAG
jgi:hypothetical protein